MLIEALPRLTDEERDQADDEYAVMPAAVPANLSIDDLIAQRTAALDAMRTAGDDFAAFCQASKQEAQLSAEIRGARRQASDSCCPDCHGGNPPPADLSYPERWRDRVLLGLADGRVAKVDVGKPYVNAKRLVLGFLSRLRRRRQQRLLARAQEWLEACQCAAENHPACMTTWSARQSSPSPSSRRRTDRKNNNRSRSGRRRC